MRRILFTITILLLLASIVLAAPVSKDVAKQAAKDFLQSSIERANLPGLDKATITPLYDGSELIAYVYELESGGFVVTSADTDLRVVLAFSSSDQFDYLDIEENAFLDILRQDVKGNLKHLPAEDRQLNAIEWSRRPEVPDVETVIGPLLSTTWSQTPPYNNACPFEDPTSSSQRRPVGCVATALGQIVNYWKYPPNISFSENDVYTSNADGVINIDTDATLYGFPTFAELNSMLVAINYDWVIPNQLEYFNFGVGVKLQMQYGLGGSSASTSAAAAVLLNDLHYYSANVISNYRVGCWSKNVHDLVVQNLSLALPVQVAIYGTNVGGHSVVVDGYQDTNDFFHINMGWGGYGDLWYSLPVVTMGSTTTFSMVRAVVYDIRPTPVVDPPKPHHPKGKSSDKSNCFINASFN